MPELLGKKIKLFSLSANHELAQEIAESIGVELSSKGLLSPFVALLLLFKELQPDSVNNIEDNTNKYLFLTILSPF